MRTAVLTCGTFILLFSSGFAADRPVATVTVLHTAPLSLDGKLDEPVWQRVTPIGPLTMVEPREGAPSTFPTEVYVLATADALWIGVYCHDSDPASITVTSMRRDDPMEREDYIRIVIDPFLDGRTGYVFAVNPAGARYDALVAREGEGENANWDGIWDARTHYTADGWTAEIWIPIRSIRFRPGLDRWGFNVERRIERFQEVDRWASPIRNFKVSHVARAGILRGLPSFHTGTGLTIRPYFLGGRQRFWPETPANRWDLGLDVMATPGGNVSALLSLNTDFAETEVDARQINLTRFPLFFPEKRTFFLEGADVFDFGLGLRVGPRWDVIPFFSRRIGLLRGQVIPLDGAMKVTGRWGAWNFGILDVLTRPVEGLVPRTNLLAARVFRNLWAESKAGMIVTAGDPAGTGRGPLLGLDFIYKTSHFRGDKNFLIGLWGLVHLHPEPEGRPVAWGVKIDYPNDLWDVALIFKYIGMGFDPPLGFVPWRCIWKWNMGIQYKPRPKWSWVRQMFHEAFLEFVLGEDGRVQRARAFTSPINWLLESGDRFEINVIPQWERVPEDFAITETVHVLAGTYHWTRSRVQIETAARRWWNVRLSYETGPFYDGHMHRWEWTLGVRPSPHVQFAVQGESNRGDLSTGRFSILLLQTRLEVAVTPDVTVSTFIQYDNLSRSIGAQTRFRWTWRSVLDVFIVLNLRWADFGTHWRHDQQQILVKVQYAWQP